MRVSLNKNIQPAWYLSADRQVEKQIFSQHLHFLIAFLGYGFFKPHSRIHFENEFHFP